MELLEKATRQLQSGEWKSYNDLYEEVIKLASQG